eukprot:CAMPEP_0197036808 /NCGR_PEP_ID=MMETSP1384-20130603/14193_1 /TAXON_ID=29189 /ORGANISM="Ammonia sp." /LENGTH=578 /DNA_ID=CAMNT_0042467023 /DNA_START=27 /DNA_END=1763 /DNA_ORIENTATION=-
MAELVSGIPSTMNDSYQLNLRKMFERGCRIQRNNEIVTRVDGGYHRMTYAQLQHRATRIASALQKCGVGIGDRVASFMWNNARHLMLYYAVPSMGCVLHTLNFRLHAKELAYLIQHADNQVIFVDADVLPLLEAVPVSAFANVKKIIVCGDNMKSGGWTQRNSSLPSAVDFELFEATGDSTYHWPELDERSAMALCYTSGTTGNPKGVAYSHRSTYLHTLAAMTADCQSLKGYDCVLPIVPMFHALGWGYPFIALTMGLKILFVHNSKDYTDVLDMCLHEECNLVAGVPTVMQAFRAALQANPAKYAALKGKLTRCICGGSAPPAELIEWFINHWQIELIQAWGMTETNPLGTVARRCATRRDLENNQNGKHQELTKNQQVCGLAMPLVELRVVNPDNLDQPLPADGEQVGELLCKGPWVTKEYFGVDAKEKFHGDGWLKTGDMAVITKDQQMVIRDRSKDMIKSGGEWISSVDMENHVMALNEVDMAVVVAVPHPKWDERPIVIVTLKNGSKDEAATKQKIRKHLKTRFSKFQLPDDILVWSEIPLTGTGKMSKKLVREKLNKLRYTLPTLRIQSKL